MMGKKYIVRLPDEERKELQSLFQKGRVRARQLNRAHILLLANDGESDEEIAAVLHTSLSTVQRTRQRWVEEGCDAVLHERRRPGKKRLLLGRLEAFLVALACSDPPCGRKRWTMQLLADRLIELTVVAAISDETVRRTLKKTP
jgi:transposase